MQEDHHQPFLNVFEQMTMACNLKLKPGTYLCIVLIYSITNKFDYSPQLADYYLLCKIFNFIQIFYSRLSFITI